MVAAWTSLGEVAPEGQGTRRAVRIPSQYLQLLTDEGSSTAPGGGQGAHGVRSSDTGGDPCAALGSRSPWRSLSVCERPQRIGEIRFPERSQQPSTGEMGVREG